jgi:hypothetical protein
VFTIKWKPVHVAVESMFTIPWKHCSPSRGIRNLAWVTGGAAVGEFYASFFSEASFLALMPRYVSPVILMVSAECLSRSRMASKITASGMTSFQ